MNNIVTIEQAKRIMGENLVGPNELKKVSFLNREIYVPSIPFSVGELEKKKKDYLLILGVEKLMNGKKATIRNLQSIFGKNPDISEPCFYNQDWYDNEDFIDEQMQNEWFFIRKNVYEDSRAVQPEELIKIHKFPTAIFCTYAFFVAWQSLGVKLWYHDFVWCNNTDHNGDRIYVGKYHDIDGINKNGFSIHRQLTLKKCYGCID